jgi:hypothetical protein
MINFKKFFNILFCLLLISSSSVVCAQDTDEDEEDASSYARIKPHHSVSLEVGMPVGLRNSAFSAYMQGIVNTSPYYHYSFKNKLTAGVGLNYNYFWINHVLTPDPKNLGGIHALGGYLRCGYESFHTDRYGIDFNIKLGKSHLVFDSDNNHKLPALPTLNVYYVEPSVGFVITVDEQSSYRWVLGYGVQKYHFVPSILGFDSSANSSSSSDKVNLFSRIAGYTHYLSIGFGYTYYFKQR